ncbi:helix-turn-helix domain-containing protein (plasmid) [Nocardia sp. NBC_01377]|uniref:helix-turn-helix domain-containing protein n=1 Tax=Nocardia sp. NBC_01377 TaxID=2903595 RepID=UPI002F90D404
MPETPEDPELVRDRRLALGQRLRTLRTDRNLSQSAVAAAAGLARPYYGGIESGQHNISVANLWAIADALGVDIGELFTSSSTEKSD